MSQEFCTQEALVLRFGNPQAEGEMEAGDLSPSETACFKWIRWSNDQGLIWAFQVSPDMDDRWQVIEQPGGTH